MKRHSMKSIAMTALSLAALSLAAGPALAEQAPIATCDTDVFQYWRLNGEAPKDYLPPLDAKGEAALHDYAYSLTLQAALWGIRNRLGGHAEATRGKPLRSPPALPGWH
jgi:hypothetical protein